MKKYVSALVVAAATLSATSAMAQFAKPEDAVKYRQSALFVMQQNVGRIAAMVQGKAPFDAKVAADSAAVAEYMAKLPWAAFVPGSDKAGNSKAKAEVWSDSAKFNAAADKMQAEMAKLNAAAKTGSLDAIKPAMGAVGGTCKGCHDDFRAQ
jgi:cytochrome c556